MDVSKFTVNKLEALVGCGNLEIDQGIIELILIERKTLVFVGQPALKLKNRAVEIRIVFKNVLAILDLLAKLSHHHLVCFRAEVKVFIEYWNTCDSSIPERCSTI